MSELGDAAVAYARMGWAVLPLGRAGKVPAIRGGSRSAVSDPTQAAAWWSVSPEHNVGVATGAASGGLFVIDVDVDPATGEDGRAELDRWERAHGTLPTTATAVTGRGGLHLYFHSDAGVRNSTNRDLGIDVRGDGGFVVVPPSRHPNGNRYEWGNAPFATGVAEADANVLALVAHVQAPRAQATGSAPYPMATPRFELPSVVAKGCRDDTLFRYASSLQARGLTDAEIADAVAEANRERCVPPMGEADIARIVGGVCCRYEKGADRGSPPGADGAHEGRRPHFRRLDRNGNPTGPVRHNVVAHELIERHQACYVDGAPAIWSGGRYASGWDEVNRATVGLIDDCRMADQKEIRHYVHLKAPRVDASPPWLVAFDNGVLDLDGGFGPMDSSMVITNVIPHAYRPDAYDGTCDRFLDGVSHGDALVRANLEEVVGMCMYRANDFGQCPVLIGTGSNGKSTYISALRNVLGTENVSSLDVSILGKPFQAGRLLGRLANLGDDISNERLSGDVLAVFKKVVTGEWIYTDVKNSDGFEFKPYCTLVFSCNEFPSLGDSSEGMLRRLFPIPFDARFSRGDAGYDPRLWDKLRSEHAAEYLIRLGVEGLRRVIANNGLTPNERSEELMGEVRCDNDTVLQWMHDRDLSADDFEGRVIAECYGRYSDWCRDANLRPFGKSKFTRKVNATLGYASVPEKRAFTDGTRTARVFRPQRDAC